MFRLMSYYVCPLAKGHRSKGNGGKEKGHRSKGHGGKEKGNGGKDNTCFCTYAASSASFSCLCLAVVAAYQIERVTFLG